MHPPRLFQPTQLWFTTLALALALIGPSALAAGGKPPEEPGYPWDEVYPDECWPTNGLCVGDDVVVRPFYREFSPTPGTLIEQSDGKYCYFKVRFFNDARKSGFYPCHELSVTKSYAEKSREREEKNRQAKEGLIDLAVYNEFRSNGRDHEEALAESRGPVWLSFHETGRFLVRLSQHVYAFDREYLSQIVSLLATQDAQPERRNQFAAAALSPFLKNFSYREIKERWINASLERITASLAKNGIQRLTDVEDSTTTRRLALQMLAASLTTAKPQMSPSQRAEAELVITAIGKAAASPLRLAEMQEFLTAAPGMENLLLDLAKNPYLTARAATDMALLEFLRNL